jgi:hypothetical protein
VTVGGVGPGTDAETEGAVMLRAPVPPHAAKAAAVKMSNARHTRAIPGGESKRLASPA